MNENNLTNDDTKVIKTDIDSINGQDKCPKCGSTVKSESFGGPFTMNLKMLN